MSSTTVLDPASTDAATHRERARTASKRIPLSRLVGVELRKMFDTRSGFWLMASILITSVLATAAARARHRPASRSPGWSVSSCARCSTPARASG